MKSKWIAAVLLSAPLLAPPYAMPVAHAQEEGPQAQLKGFAMRMTASWSRDNLDRYTFKADGTYLFTKGNTKNSAGLMSHAGTWKVTNYSRPADDSIDSRATLHLHTDFRVIYKAGKYQDITTPRDYTATVMFTEADNQILINRISYEKVKPELS